MSDVHEEFLAEVQEIIESLSRDLLLLDQAQKDGQVQPDLINEVFRGVHTLKGIAGMFGYAQLGVQAHSLEDLLDDLRLGRITLSQEVLDILFEGVEGFQRTLAEDQDEDIALSIPAPPPPLAAEPPPPPPPPPSSSKRRLEDYDLDPSVLAVLTEYEEHRLRTNAQDGVPLYRLAVRFSLTTIDANLEELKERAKGVAEIITYLPSMESGGDDSIELDVILASRAPSGELAEALGEAQLVAIPLKEQTPTTHHDELAPIKQAPKRPRESPPAQDFAVEQLSLRSVAQTVRVDIRKLDVLMNVVGELSIVRAAVGRVTDRVRGRPELRQLALELHRLHRDFDRRLDELQIGILDVRMVPLGQLFDKLARIVRQVAREHDKDVRLAVTGADTEVDKLIVEELSDPLMHLIRNAIDHGIETPAVRELAGKPTTGTLALNAYQKGNHVVLEIDDDGAGMNERLLLEAATRKGLIPQEAAAELTREEVFELVFLPGFSTRSSITDLSGRGVGMDVVKTNISRLGGVIDIQSDFGSGTKLTITLPITLAIISSLIVRIAGRPFAIPITSVQEAIVLDPTRIRTVEGREVLTLRGSTLTLCRLDVFFDFPDTNPEKRFVVVCAVGNRRLGFVVDGLEGQQDIVIKALGESLSKIRGFAGATDLGDQRVALVLDAPGLIEEVLRSSDLPSLEAR